MSLLLPHLQGAFPHKPLTLKRDEKAERKRIIWEESNWTQWKLKLISENYARDGAGGGKEKVNKKVYRINIEIL